MYRLNFHAALAMVIARLVDIDAGDGQIPVRRENISNFVDRHAVSPFTNFFMIIRSRHPSGNYYIDSFNDVFLR